MPFLILTMTGQNISEVNPTEMNINSDLQRKQSNKAEQHTPLETKFIQLYCNIY